MELKNCKSIKQIKDFCKQEGLDLHWTDLAKDTILEIRKVVQVKLDRCVPKSKKVELDLETLAKDLLEGGVVRVDTEEQVNALSRMLPDKGVEWQWCGSGISAQLEELALLPIEVVYSVRHGYLPSSRES